QTRWTHEELRRGCREGRAGRQEGRVHQQQGVRLRDSELVAGSVWISFPPPRAVVRWAAVFVEGLGNRGSGLGGFYAWRSCRAGDRGRDVGWLRASACFHHYRAESGPIIARTGSDRYQDGERAGARRANRRSSGEGGLR